MASADRKVSSSGRTVLRFIIAILIIGTLAGVIFLIFSNQPKTVSGSSSIVYRVTGSVSSAVITYTKPDGIISEPIEVNLPWTSRPTRYRSGTIIVVTAALPGNGRVKCIILSDNRVVDENELAPFIDKALCGVVVK